jgi:5'-3' exonuclease
MQILDYNGIAIAAITVHGIQPEEDLLRHHILNSIRMYNVKFRKEYGQMVIACDSRSWRRDYFPQYKHSRGKGRDESTLDWGKIFDLLNMYLEEIRANMPYKVIHINGAEADDIIGALAIESQEFGKGEPVMIISSDKDFGQLQKFSNVKQFSPYLKKQINVENPRTFLAEHLFKGDSGDGIPNILSPDNTFVDAIRQKPVSQKKMDEWLRNIDNLQSVMNEETYRNFCRNRKLIDLTEMPKELYDQIIAEYETQKPASKLKVMNYLIQKRCRMLVECSEEFF